MPKPEVHDTGKGRQTGQRFAQKEGPPGSCSSSCHDPSPRRGESLRRSRRFLIRKDPCGSPMSITSTSILPHPVYIFNEHPFVCCKTGLNQFFPDAKNCPTASRAPPLFLDIRKKPVLGQPHSKQRNVPCYENKTRSKKLNLDNKCFQQL